MSATTSATTGRHYGLQRVCRAWERARSALYARRTQAERRRQGDGPARRGPQPLRSDEQLLAAIRTDLARSPFQGEGHRKVHARLRIVDGILGRPDAGAPRDASPRGALAPPRAPGRSEPPRRDPHHRSAPGDVGDRRRAGVHHGRRVGLDLRGG